MMEGPILRRRPAGGGGKPPQGAAVKSRGAELAETARRLIASGVGCEGERKRTVRWSVV